MSSKRISSPRLVHLQAFVAVAEKGSFTGAGKALRCDQSSVSRYVVELEKWLGPPLLFNGTAELTSAGERFLPIARQVVELLVDAKEGLSSAGPAANPIDPNDIEL